MENRNDCKNCPLERRVEDLEKRTTHQGGRMDSTEIATKIIKEGIFGNFNTKGILPRIDLLENNLVLMQQTLGETKRLAESSRNILITLAFTIVGGIGIAIISKII